MSEPASQPAPATDLVGLMSQLTEPPMPEPVSMWPATAAWAWLAVAGVLLLAWFGWRWVQHYRANAYRRAALAELRVSGLDVAGVSSVLRRAALVVWSRSEVASLTGPAWLDFLDRTGGGGKFSKGPGQPLAHAPIHPRGEASHELVALAERWVTQHTRPESSK